MKKIERTGFFVDGRLVNWVCHPKDAVTVLKEDGQAPKVMVGDVEIVPWSKKLQKSTQKRQWYTP